MKYVIEALRTLFVMFLYALLGLAGCLSFGHGGWGTGDITNTISYFVNSTGEHFFVDST